MLAQIKQVFRPLELENKEKHAHIYLLDEKNEKLVVAEGTGAVGKEMKARERLALSN